MKPDLRTRKGRQREVIDYCKDHTRMSMFWIMESKVRASVVQDMHESGELKLIALTFPMYRCEYKGEK